MLFSPLVFLGLKAATEVLPKVLPQPPLKSQPGHEGHDHDNAPTVEESIEEAAQQTYGKQSKIATLDDMVVVDQMDAIAGDELDAVRRYREMKVFDNKDSKDSVSPPVASTRGDLIACDNMEIHVTPPASTAPVKSGINPIVAGLLGAAIVAVPPLAVAGGYLLNSVLNSKSVESQQSTDTKEVWGSRVGDIKVTEPGE